MGKGQRQQQNLTADDLQLIIDDEERPVESAEEAETAEQGGFDSVFSKDDGAKGELDTARSEVDALEPDDLDKDKGKKPAAKKAEGDEPAPGSGDADTDQGLTSVLTELTGISTRLRNIEGKQGYYNDEIQKIQKSAADAADKGTKGKGGSPTAEQIAEANEDPDLRTQLEEDYPDWFKWADQHEAVVNARVDAKLEKLDDKVSKSDVQTIVNDTIREVNAERDLLEEYPEWVKTTGTNEFADWFRAQSESVQALGASQNSVDVHAVMKGYSAFVKAKAKPDDDDPLPPDDKDDTDDEDATHLTADEIAEKKVKDLAAAIAPTKSKGNALPTKKRGAQTEQEGFDSVFAKDKEKE